MAKKTSIKDNLGSLVDVDTTELSLEGLQRFCVRVHTELVKVEKENRELELERNKLKLYVDIAQNQLKKSTNTKNQFEYMLKEQKRKGSSNGLEMTNCLRNLQVDVSKTSLAQMVITFQKVQSMNHNSLEQHREIENDITSMKKLALKHDINTNSNLHNLTIERDKQLSNEIQSSITNKKLFVLHFNNMSSKIIQSLNDKNNASLKKLNDYKNKQIDDCLKENENFLIMLRHYYENITKKNRMILDNIQGEDTLVKKTIKYLESSVQSEKQKLLSTNTEVFENKAQVKTLKSKLFNYDKGKREQIHRRRVHLQHKLEYNQWSGILLEEALILKQQCRDKFLEKGKEDILKIQLQITEQSLLLEEMLKKLSSKVKQIDEILSCAKARNRFARKDLTTKKINEIAFTELEKDLQEEFVNELRKSIRNHSSY